MRTQKQHLGFYAILAFILGAVTGGPLLADDNEITWLGDYREAVRQAKQSHKPIFLEFRCEA